MPAAIETKKPCMAQTMMARMMPTLNSEVIQALVPPTEASPDWMRALPVDISQLRRKTRRNSHQKSGRRRVCASCRP